LIKQPKVRKYGEHIAHRNKNSGRLIILFNGFQKKAEKTFKKEMEKAKKIKRLYYESKQTR
jgi:hypothetical protein